MATEFTGGQMAVSGRQSGMCQPKQLLIQTSALFPEMSILIRFVRTEDLERM